jgi:DNA-binding NarL/FixJ family response regulator
MDGTGSLETRRVATSPPWRMLIVSQVRFLRESLAEIFASDGGWIILGMPDDLPGALALCASAGPDVVLLDAAFPHGTRSIRPILDAAPGSRVVALALTETEDNVVAWAEAGAAGYVPNTAGLAELAVMLATIVNGAQACSARVAAGLLRRIAEGGASSDRSARLQSMTTPPPASLTARERQIVGMIGTGMSNKEIARNLSIGVATTKSHVHNLLGKLNIQRRGQAAAWVRENGAS